MSQFWSDRTHQLTPYTPGEQPKDVQYIKLNTNENPYPPSEAVQQAIISASGDDLRLYSDPSATDLKSAIAEFYSVDITNVFVSNSSDEVLAHTFVALLKHDAPLLFPDISYSFYPVYCKLFDIESMQIPLTDNFEIDIKDYPKENGGIIFPNPNAPTGKALSLEVIEQFLQAHPNSVIVIDEAYVDFGADSAISLINQYDNLLVVQTFSKSRSLAGLRVGFAVGNSALIEGLERVKNSFHPYALARNAIAGATASIKDVANFDKNRQKIIATREKATTALEALGFKVIPSSANFVFAKPPQGFEAESLYLQLKNKGILVRYFNAPRIDGYLRITIGTDDEMSSLSRALKEIIT
ncbi:MAG TPA: histidinol-phosphate transaminase [Thiothrix sp.]|nr:histidinol-phosphate transaminase [Thiothrix sp.]